MTNLHNEIVKYSRLLFERGFCASTEGNVSVRLKDGNFLITPSKRVKVFLSPRDLVVIDWSGNVVRGKGVPTTERFTHLEIYRQRPDAMAVVHAHPKFVTVASSLGRDPFAKPFLAETAMFFSNVRFAPFALPSTKEGAEAIRGLCEGADAIVADRHGAFTWGSDVESAFAVMDALEKIAEADYLARLTGEKVRYLDAKTIKALREVKY
jgi:L-fuculose-phosphate aldolase